MNGFRLEVKAMPEDFLDKSKMIEAMTIDLGAINDPDINEEVKQFVPDGHSAEYYEGFFDAITTGCFLIEDAPTRSLSLNALTVLGGKAAEKYLEAISHVSNH